ncbi:rhamnan synthesis F family protein [Microbacterium sp. bgisy203]|uniref:rhamnan synthesis F family protein n=1 Tax=Microbacterium sp. bgisy203 TaxID=3413799 RepID=UPI003D760165
MNPHSSIAEEGTNGVPEGTSRLVIYALASEGAALDGSVRRALSALRAHATRLVVVVATSLRASDRQELVDLADRVVVGPAEKFEPSFYAVALAHSSANAWDEILLTGDSWFGPVDDFAPLFSRMSGGSADFWQLAESRQGLVRDFPDQGFPRRSWPWTWTVVRRSAIEHAAWAEYWRHPRDSFPVDGGEEELRAHLEAAGLVGDHAYLKADFPDGHPTVFAADRLLDAGCPIASRVPFSLYPPFLQQHAVIGRDTVRALHAHGYPLEVVWPTLARTVPAKALNANAGMLEVIPRRSPALEVRLRIAVVAYVSDVSLADELLRYVENVPEGFDLYVTTTDGIKASRLRAMLDDRPTLGAKMIDIRVTPTGGGGDMGDFFVGCRDVIASDEYDLIVKAHVRRKRAKTAKVRRYFRRYQWDNVLGSPSHVSGILALFAKEPGLGMVFPPMIHIGYQTMGRGWARYRDRALALLKRLDVRVPVDRITPLAPYGATWIARPAALRRVASLPWTYSEYKSFPDLGRVQERVLVPAAAADGFHVRTVLTPDHAAISHTALEFKADQLMSTTTGYPVDQITLLHRAGATGRGGPVGLSRMYLRINHPRVARITLPVMAVAERWFLRVRDLRHRSAARRVGRTSGKDA